MPAGSYDPSLLETSLLMQVRLKIGDTGPDFILSDDEISFFINQANEDTLRASIQALNAVISKLSQTAIDFKLGPYSETNSSRLAYYVSLRDSLISTLVSVYAPLMRPPTTAPIFTYNMMSTDRFKAGDSFDS